MAQVPNASSAVPNVAGQFLVEQMNGGASTFVLVPNEHLPEEPLLMKLVDATPKAPANQSFAKNEGSSSENVLSKVSFTMLMAKLLKSQMENCDFSVTASVPIAEPSNGDSSNVASIFPQLRDSHDRPYMLQPSLFPVQYPTVYFSADDENSKSTLVFPNQRHC